MRFVECLEFRQFLNGYATFRDGILRIFGTDYADTIGIASNGPTAVAGGNHYGYQALVNAEKFGPELDMSTVRLIRVYGYGGDDTITLPDQFVSAEEPRVSVYISGQIVEPERTYSQPKSVIEGSAGNDLIDVKLRRSTLHGGRGNDTLRGGDAEDEIMGGEGDDLLDGRGGADLIVGGHGADTVDYSDRTDPIAAVLTHDAPNPGVGPWGPNGFLDIDGRTSTDRAGSIALPDLKTLAGSGGLEGDTIASSVENAVGGSGNDVMVGNTLSNTLDGGPGDDFIVGGLGVDTLYGGDGNDTLLAADYRDRMPIGIILGQVPPGRDSVNGGAGRDYARLDADIDYRRQKVERVETLPGLWS